MINVKNVMVLLSLCFVIPGGYALTAEEEQKLKAAFEVRKAAAEQRRIAAENAEEKRKLEFQATPEMVSKKAELARAYYKALIEKGFTEEQALTIVGGM